MIKEIKLKNCTPYQEASISNCKKVNFIFGANGSGKSTISSFLSGSEDPRFNDSSIVWDGETHERIEVYNRDFRKSNLKQEMQGIFTLGNATIEDINELEQLKSDLARATEIFEDKCKAYDNQVNEVMAHREEQFKEDVWIHILKRNEVDFKKAFEGFRGSKERFVSELKKRIGASSEHNGNVCNRQSLIDRARVLYNENQEKCNTLTVDIDLYLQKIKEFGADELLSTSIVGSADVDIAALIEELGNLSWVSQGREYVKSNSKKCPFCQAETITEEFIEKLDAFFDTEFNNKVNAIRNLHTEYKSNSEYLILEIEKILNEDSFSIQIGKLDIDAYNTKKELLKRELETNISAIECKIKEPEKRIVLTDITSIIDDINAIISKANVIINAHNDLIDTRDEEELSLCDDIWATCINEEFVLIETYKKDIADINKAIESIKAARDEKKSEVEKLTISVNEKGKNITSVQPAIIEINRYLKAYGFTGFSIQPAEDKDYYYCIKRSDGTYATDTLSEGEETFLTFLYFMQMIKGATNQEHVSDKKIVVLDDPICSLDSTVLYIVATIVKELSKMVRSGEGDVNQLFVLTHNVFFHKEASFIDGRTKKLKDVNYWFIRKNEEVAIICPYGQENPISTSYNLLWKELRDNESASLITIQNVMRRIIENYFGMLGSKRDDKLLEKFKTAEEKRIAESLLLWVNEGSHSIPDDLFVDPYTDATPKYKDVFKKLFYYNDHAAHYNMMMGIDDDFVEDNEEDAKEIRN